MLAYAVASTLGARCKRAGLLVESLAGRLQEAARAGAEQDVDQFLNSEGRWLQYGLVRPNLLIPTPMMVAFREQAKNAKGKGRSGTVTQLPGFWQWFVDWILPPLHGSRRQGLMQGFLDRGLNDLSQGMNVPRPADALTLPVVPPRQLEQRGPAANPEIPASNTAGANASNHEKRKRRSHEKHLRWKVWKDAGLSYGDIVNKHKHETGETVTRDAVIQALRRL